MAWLRITLALTGDNCPRCDRDEIYKPMNRRPLAGPISLVQKLQDDVQDAR